MQIIGDEERRNKLKMAAIIVAIVKDIVVIFGTIYTIIR